MPMPALPGAHHIRVTWGDWASFQTSACSRPPEPMTSSFIEAGIEAGGGAGGNSFHSRFSLAVRPLTKSSLVTAYQILALALTPALAPPLRLHQHPDRADVVSKSKSTSKSKMTRLRTWSCENQMHLLCQSPWPPLAAGRLFPCRSGVLCPFCGAMPERLISPGEYVASKAPSNVAMTKVWPLRPPPDRVMRNRFSMVFEYQILCGIFNGSCEQTLSNSGEWISPPAKEAKRSVFQEG